MGAWPLKVDPWKGMAIEAILLDTYHNVQYSARLSQGLRRRFETPQLAKARDRG